MRRNIKELATSLHSSEGRHVASTPCRMPSLLWLGCRHRTRATGRPAADRASRFSTLSFVRGADREVHHQPSGNRSERLTAAFKAEGDVRWRTAFATSN